MTTTDALARLPKRLPFLSGPRLVWRIVWDALKRSMIHRRSNDATPRRVVATRATPRFPSLLRATPRLPRHPILLAHGYLGFGALGQAGARRYFRGVREYLESIGCQVHLLSVPPAASVAVRARELARQVTRIDADRVNIVAHSMGGLDARYAISRLGMSSKVASLVTLGTPHRGTPLADLLYDGVHALSGDGLRDLTTPSSDEFNLAVRDVDSVRYGSIACSSTRVPGFLSMGFDYLRRVAGPNDGMVPTASQRWGRVLREVDADHLAQIGWSNHFDVRSLYAFLVAHVASWGC